MADVNRTVNPRSLSLKVGDSKKKHLTFGEDTDNELEENIEQDGSGKNSKKVVDLVEDDAPEVVFANSSSIKELKDHHDRQASGKSIPKKKSKRKSKVVEIVQASDELLSASVLEAVEEIGHAANNDGSIPSSEPEGDGTLINYNRKNVKRLKRIGHLEIKTSDTEDDLAAFSVSKSAAEFAASLKTLQKRISYNSYMSQRQPRPARRFK